MALRFIALGTLVLASLAFSSPIEFPSIEKKEDIVALFPKSAEEIETLKEETLSKCGEALSELKAQSKKNLSFETLVYPLDQIQGYLTMIESRIEALTLVQPDPALREAAFKAELSLSNFSDSIYSNESGLYKDIQKFYVSHKESLTSDQQYLTEQILWSFEMAGQKLPKKERAKVAKINQEITELEQAFNKNIQEDTSHVYVNKEALNGLNEKTIEAFSKNENGQYRLGCDYPTYFSIMQTCANANTRKELLKLFRNRAYPNNQEILSQLIEKRDEQARLLGFESYAHLSLANEMSGNPKVVSGFLKDLWNKSKPKEIKEFQKITASLPKEIALTDQGKLKAWDAGYVFDHYKKTNFEIDDDKIAEYFPLESTFTGLMHIYEQFFDIKIIEEPITGLWHEDVRLLKICEKDSTLIGYVLLDLFPRENKYTHACDVPGLAMGVKKDGKANPSVDLVVANFTKPTEKAPSLLKHTEVKTFFHEFGHALHDLFSKHEYASFASIASPYMKIDFVELPSQMLEEWLWSPQILSKLSSHYETGKNLPQGMIQKLIDSKNCVSASFVQNQCYLSFLALNYFSEGGQKDISQIAKDLQVHMRPNYQPLEEDHHELSFGHLTGYGPRYYGYLWSKVFALDIFQEIKKEGLLNSKVGKRYRKTILEKGPSQNPNDLLEAFLGRKPSQEAFIKELGL